MFHISKRIEVAGSHRLDLPYDSACTRMHGHNWIITVEVKGPCLNDQGILVDFQIIKQVVNQLDHQELNKILPQDTNPTAENIAEWVYNMVNLKILDLYDPLTYGADIPYVCEVTVQESEGNIAWYTL